jgi:hypothetical protein
MAAPTSTMHIYMELETQLALDAPTWCAGRPPLLLRRVGGDLQRAERLWRGLGGA